MEVDVFGLKLIRIPFSSSSENFLCENEFLVNV